MDIEETKIAAEVIKIRLDDLIHDARPIDIVINDAICFIELQLFGVVELKEDRQKWIDRAKKVQEESLDLIIEISELKLKHQQQIKKVVIDAHQSGQFRNGAGCDASFSDAQSYYKETFNK